MNYTIRRMNKSEYPLLNEFLYQAIFIPEGAAPPAYDIIYRPELRIYTENFGTSEHDRAFAAVCGEKVIGAVWVRIMNDYGHIDDETPSFAISLYPEYRRNGIGTELMKTMLDELKRSGYKRASLSVQKANYAKKMYLKLGFEITNENEEEYIMIINLEGVHIRTMHISDYDAVYALWLSCSGMGLNNIDDSKDGVKKFLDRNPETCFVAETDSGIVGVIMAGNDGRRGYIYHTAVHPDHRKRGIAKKLVESAETALKNLGICKTALVVFERNVCGNSFWEKLGFTARDDLVYRNKALTEIKRIDT